MNNLQCRKAYVRVNLDVDEEGTIIPMLIRWKDGRVFQIEQLKYKCRASSNKVGGGGIRYTVMIRGKESFLFHEGMLRAPKCPFVLFVGTKKLVKRKEFEQFISEKLVI
jgi:hypothetical protein